MAKKKEVVAASDWKDPKPKKVEEKKSDVQLMTSSPIVQPISVVPYDAKAKRDDGMSCNPIIQPISFVPYAGNSLWQNNEAKEEPAPTPAVPETPVAVAPEKKKVRFIPILLAIFSLLVIAVMVIGKYALTEYLAILDGKSGLDYIMTDLIDCFSGSFEIAKFILPLSVAVVALFSIVNFITSLCTMFKKGASVLSKISIFFMLVFALVLCFIGLVNDITLGYGLYAVAGLSFLSLVFGYLSRNN